MNYIQPIIKTLVKAGWFPSLLIICGFIYVFVLILILFYYMFYAICFRLGIFMKK